MVWLFRMAKDVSLLMASLGGDDLGAADVNFSTQHDEVCVE